MVNNKTDASQHEEGNAAAIDAAKQPPPPPPPPPPPALPSPPETLSEDDSFDMSVERRAAKALRNGRRAAESKAETAAKAAAKARARNGNGDGIQSLQKVIFESMEETRRVRRSRSEADMSTTGIFIDTMRDISTAASGTLTSIKKWANSPGPDGAPHPRREGVPNVDEVVRKNSLLQDLVWPFAVCGLEVSGDLQRNDIAPHLRKMKDAVTKSVNGVMHPGHDVWRFSAASRDDDDNTVSTIDTLQEERNQIRRLGSWGTVGTAGTNVTSDTGINSLETSTTNVADVNLEDDDGNIIDPVLFEKAQKYREKRTPRRIKLVKFDYPPIKSLKQYPRHNPEDLPNLFFTEHELDQIEDDRYSTMSTDDIEIVAVSSKACESDQSVARGKAHAKRGASFGSASGADARSSAGSTNGREQPETGWKPTKERPKTPHRSRKQGDDADFPSIEAKSPSSSSRLVKGVQIYLRERSTGS